MYTATAAYYDKVYGFKDYASETQKLISFIQAHQHVRSRRLLDIACGTGQHLAHLMNHFQVTGLDLDAGMLEVARARLPGVPFYHGDMVDFALAETFDVVTCLFSSIGYTRTLEAMRRAIATMAAHLVPGGLLIVEPWFTPEMWHPGTVHMTTVDEPQLKIARASTSLSEGRLSYFDLHYLIATPQGTEHRVERHELGLFTRDEMETAFVAAGMSVHYDPEGLTGRGLYLAHPTSHSHSCKGESE